MQVHERGSSLANVSPRVTVAPNAVLTDSVEPSSGSLLGLSELSILPIADGAECECAPCDLNVVPVLFLAALDDRVVDNIACSVVGLVHFLEVIPILSGHGDPDAELPTLALVLHHSLVLDLPVFGPIVVLDQTDTTAAKV